MWQKILLFCTPLDGVRKLSLLGLKFCTMDMFFCDNFKEDHGNYLMNISKLLKNPF